MLPLWCLCFTAMWFLCRSINAACCRFYYFGYNSKIHNYFYCCNWLHYVKVYFSIFQWNVNAAQAERMRGIWGFVPVSLYALVYGAWASNLKLLFGFVFFGFYFSRQFIILLFSDTFYGVIIWGWCMFATTSISLYSVEFRNVARKSQFSQQLCDIVFLKFFN